MIKYLKFLKIKDIQITQINKNNKTGNQKMIFQKQIEKIKIQHLDLTKAAAKQKKTNSPLLIIL